VAVVTSSFEELVAPVLGDTLGSLELVGNRLVRDRDGWRAAFASAEVCAVCGEPCKRALVAALPASQVVYVGDGYSDRCAAEAAERVFARDGLARHLTGLGVPFEPWEDFRDIAAALGLERAAA
jgi:2-hydroxy-3-keto-5-methylthiopentenyl-1-phosphate phosphatase